MGFTHHLGEYLLGHFFQASKSRKSKFIALIFGVNFHCERHEIHEPSIPEAFVVFGPGAIATVDIAIVFVDPFTRISPDFMRIFHRIHGIYPTLDCKFKPTYSGKYTMLIYRMWFVGSVPFHGIHGTGIFTYI